MCEPIYSRTEILDIVILNALRLRDRYIQHNYTHTHTDRGKQRQMQAKNANDLIGVKQLMPSPNRNKVAFFFSYLLPCWLPTFGHGSASFCLGNEHFIPCKCTEWATSNVCWPSMENSSFLHDLQHISGLKWTKNFRFDCQKGNIPWVISWEYTHHLPAE